MTDIVLVTLDTFGEKMAGPAIRVWQMADVLSAHHNVSILTFGQVHRKTERFSLRRTFVESFENDLGSPGVVVIQGYLSQTFPWLGSREFKLVVDLYDPIDFESLEVEKYRPMADRQVSYNSARAELSGQISVGDFFLCASERQRDLWLGQLAMAGRVTPQVYDHDPTLRHLIDLVPFGLSNQAPEQSYHGVKGTIAGIGPEDKLIIWGGGIYNWFDPLTVIRAVDRARESIPNIRLMFLGAKHPNPDVPEMRMVLKARQVSDELGLTGQYVFFNEDWVDFDERQNYLLDADIGISAHFDDIETRFSFRTRMLDYLWAGLPMICTEGDYFAELIVENDLGRATSYMDVDQLSAAIVELLSDEGLRRNIADKVTRVSRQFYWKRVLEPLMRYCDAPWFAGDRKLSEDRGSHRVIPNADHLSISSLIRRTSEGIRQHGVRTTLNHVRNYLIRRRH